MIEIKSSSCYFLDFYFEDIRLDLEIDGKQHEYEDRLESDEVRDKLLKEHGYIIYRIKWKSINNEEGKKYIKEEIDKLIDFIRAMGLHGWSSPLQGEIQVGSLPTWSRVKLIEKD